MLIHRTSAMTGKNHSREISIQPIQLTAWKAGGLIQNVAPHLSPDDREFLISGITPEEWTEFVSDPLCERGFERDDSERE